MASVIELPNEILLDIFECLQGAPSSLVSAMKCSRRWNRLASSVLYRHVSLDSKLREDTPGSRFAKCASQCDLTQSFSLRITQVHLMGFSIYSKDAFDRFFELCDVISRMKNLQTFSLSFEEPIGQGFNVPSVVIVSILRSLPKTVVNINLDCDCISSPDLNQPHVCHAVSALLPRLRSLRIRTSHLCSGILSSIYPQATLDNERPKSPTQSTKPIATSSLEYLLIRLITRPESEHGPHTALCYTGDKSLHGTRLADTLQDLYRFGAFPCLRQFAVVGRVDAPPSPRNDNWNVFKVRVFNRDAMRTITFPWCARGGSSSLYMIRDSEGDWFGSFDETSTALEGPLRWTRNGIRPVQPRNYNQDDVWKLDHSRLASRASVMENFGVSFRLWKHEAATGLKLLHVRTATGFDDTEVTSQIVPYGWRWVPEGPWNWTIEPIMAN